MSMKVYTAYRLRKAEVLWPFVRDVRRKGALRIRDTIQEYYDALYGSEIVLQSEHMTRALSTYGEHEREKALKLATEMFLTRSYKEQERSVERNAWDFSASLAVREAKGQLYVIPHVGMAVHKSLSFLSHDKRLEDFSYWDNSDRPSHITSKRWEARRQVWEELTDESTHSSKLYADVWCDYLVVEICSPDLWWRVKPLFLAPSAKKEKDE
jgi:hypothetical protein